ncbi:MFS transporter [Rhizodiscina lignyota]|uniref:MFS transporter n=1 Tax=Rhizodiscina lignyota TaxID=1504668 RepID=A0A9P4M073_9PEZI|nr:MFS transporter [Rhizodiscina lignyota]
MAAAFRTKLRKRIDSFLKPSTSKIDYIPLPLQDQPTASEGNQTGAEEENRVPVDPILRTSLERALVKKLDRSLMPVLFCMIILNYLDRNALPNARVQGIEKDIGLKGEEFNTAISALFIGYITLQVPSNLFLTRVRPSVYLPICMCLWGIVSASTAFVGSFHGLAMTRFLIGFLEAPFFPGALFLLSSWYTREELATRTAVLFSGNLLSGAFGGLVGASVQFGLNNVFGLRSWQWLFMLEGSATVILSLIAFFVLPDFPSTTRWLSEQERILAIERLQKSNGSSETGQRSLIAGFLMTIRDYKVWILSAIILTKTTAAAVSSFIPTLVATFEYGKIQSLLMVAPPYLFATIASLATSISSDKRGERCYHLAAPLAIGVIGFIIAAITTGLVPRYAALFLILGGVYGGFDVAIAWVSSTLPAPAEKRATALALTNMVGNTPQIFAPYLYDKRTGPRYVPAMTANAAFLFASIGFAILLRLCLVRENRKLDAGEMAEEEPVKDTEGAKLVGSFRYVL